MSLKNENQLVSLVKLYLLLNYKWKDYSYFSWWNANMISKLNLTNYRNIKELSIDFSENETLIIWNNGQWKTSILEAIFFLCIGKAYRAHEWAESISFDENFTQIYWTTNIESDLGQWWNQNILTTNYSASFTKSPRKQIKYKIDEIPKKTFDFIWNFQCVLFSPEDLKIITWSPQERRNFIDSLLIRLDKNYAFTLNLYNKILRQRNALLKDIANWRSDESYLDVWDEKLVQNWIQVIEKRLSLVKKIEPIVESFYKEISNTNEVMKVDYHWTVDDYCVSRIKDRRKKDIIIWSTSIWPHRDDLAFSLRWKEMKDYASQWEVRTWILSLKYSEIELFNEKSQNITLLLDDVFSELDKDRQSSLIELAKNYQTIITSTDLPKWYESSLIYKISDWCIIC